MKLNIYDMFQKKIIDFGEIVLNEISWLKMALLTIHS